MKSFSEIVHESFESLRSLFRSPSVDQSVSISNFYTRIQSELDSFDNWMWLMDLFVDEQTGKIFAILASEGKLYAASLDPSSSTKVIGDLVEVRQEFVPVTNEFFLSTDKSRWFLLASSTVLNRMGYFNTKTLFDNMIARAQSSQNFPYLTFFHQGRSLQMGDTDWLGREKNILLASGTFDDSELSDAMKTAIDADPNFWGSSIHFRAYQAIRVKVFEDLFVPAYTDGELVEISLLPESDACCLLTSIVQGKVTMDKNVEDALRKLTNGNEELFNRLVERVESANEYIEDNQLLAQSVQITAEDELQHSIESKDSENEQEPQIQTTSDELPVLEIDEGLLDKIVAQVSTSDPLNSILNELSSKLSDFNLAIVQLSEKVTKLESDSARAYEQTTERLNNLEKPLEEKKEEWISDLSRSQTSKRVVYRPRESTAESASREEIAAQTIARIK